MTGDLSPLAILLESAEQENRRFRAVCWKLWPFVRYFGLCGGHPDAIAAVTEMAKLLSPDGMADQTIVEACAKSEREAIEYVASVLPEVLRGKASLREIPGIVEEIRQLPGRAVG